MREEHLSILRCPKTQSPLRLIVEKRIGSRVAEGTLINETSSFSYPIIDFIPRFVPKENYAAGFGFQWNIHNRTQYDESSKFNTSELRFKSETKWGENLSGEYILEAGSGSGRFTAEALKTGGMVVSFDYSNAVDANYKSNGQAENILIVQASIFEIPVQKLFFDKVFCFGVLQHTPNPEAAFMNLPNYLKPGGKLASDIYLKSITKWMLHPKYWVRPFTRGKEPSRLYSRIVKYVDFMWPLSRVISKIPRIGPSLNWKLLLPDYSRDLPNADDRTLKEWTYLDAMDMLSPMYDRPKTLPTFRKWHKNAGLINIEVDYGYNGIEGRGTKA